MPLVVSGRAVNLLAKPIPNVRTAADFSSVMAIMRELNVVPATPVGCSSVLDAVAFRWPWRVIALVAVAALSYLGVARLPAAGFHSRLREPAILLVSLEKRM